MKKKLGNILIFVLIIGLTIGYGIYKDSQSRVTVNKIYTMDFQEQALSDLENEKGNGNYTLQNIFMKYNPFSTNTQSMYVYFNTSKVAKITYTVSCSDYADFTATAYQAKEYQKEHEFQLIGLIPNCTNTITITATYKDGTSQSVSTNYTMGSLLGDEDIQLKQVSGSKQDLGNEDFWKDTDYTKYLYTKVGDFLTSGGQHTVTYMEDDALEYGQYYLYMFDNNFGYSKTRKDYDWTVNDGIQTSITEGTTSYYYQYLVDENEGTYTLANSFEVPFSAYVSSAQNLGDHIVVDSGIAGLLSIYDTDGNLEQQFSIKKNDRFIYRIYYYDYKGYYFS